MGIIKHLLTPDGTERVYPKTVTDAVYATVDGVAMTQEEINTEVSTSLDDLLELTVIAGLGYNIFDRGATKPMDTDGFAYGVNITSRTPTTLSSAYTSDTDLVYLPKLDLSSCTVFTNAFNGCTNLVCVQEDMGAPTNLQTAFINCTSLALAPTMDTSSTTTLYKTFRNCPSMTGSVTLDLTSATNITDLFYECTSLESVTLTLSAESSITSIANVFYNCQSLTSITANWSYLLTSVTSLYYTFYNCQNLESLDELATSSVTNFFRTFYACTSLQRIESVDFSSITNFNATFLYCSELRYLKIVNLGASSSLTSYSFPSGWCPLWGEDSDDVTDALDSLVWTFNNLYDRATAGMATCTISLYSDIYNRLVAELTTDELETISDKGYTLASI